MNPEQKQSIETIFAAADEDLYGYIAELCKRHLKQYPEDGAAWVEYGRALTELSRFEEGKSALTQALQLSDQENHYWAFVFMARIHYRRSNYLEAEKYFLKASELNPDNIGIHSYLGICAFRRGELKVAEEHCYRALECDNDESEKIQDEISFNLGGILVAQERYEEAANHYRQALALGFKSAQLGLTDIENIQKLIQQDL